MPVTKKWITSGIKASVKKKSKLYKKWTESGNDFDGEIFKKNIEEYLNQSVKKQEISIIVSFLTLSVTPLNCYGLISTYFFII